MACNRDFKELARYVKEKYGGTDDKRRPEDSFSLDGIAAGGATVTGIPPASKRLASVKTLMTALLTPEQEAVVAASQSQRRTSISVHASRSQAPTPREVWNEAAMSVPARLSMARRLWLHIVDGEELSDEHRIALLKLLPDATTTTDTAEAATAPSASNADVAVVEPRPSDLYPSGLTIGNLMQVGGVVWCGVVWCSVVWCGMLWCGGCVCQLSLPTLPP